MKPWHLVLFNLLIILFATGFIWTLFMIFFVMIAVIMMVGESFGGRLLNSK
jgi:hypothetical protein